MQKLDYILTKKLRPYVNCIMANSNNFIDSHTNIPLYADGYPGIMFQQAANGFYLLPKEKKLSELFLYGQTLKPVSLDVNGSYQFVVFQLYPFASKYLLDVNPKELNDRCFDLFKLKHINMSDYSSRLCTSKGLKQQVEIMSDLLLALIDSHILLTNDIIQQSIAIILKFKGQIKIKNLAQKIHISERTFERRFLSQVGLTPKQFARIIQFQSSIEKLTDENFQRLTDVGQSSGFSDQSHFIRTFKKYTGQTPAFFLKRKKDVI